MSTHTKNRLIAVYPGHPITIAYIITETYPDFGSAFLPVGEARYEAAVADIRIPGAGGNVYAGLELLHHLRNGAFNKVAKERKISKWRSACDWADSYWARCVATGSPLFKKGQQQADEIKPLLKGRQKWWRQK